MQTADWSTESYRRLLGRVSPGKKQQEMRDVLQCCCYGLGYGSPNPIPNVSCFYDFMVLM